MSSRARPPRVLQLLPGALPFGGTEVYVANLLKALPPELCRADVAVVAGDEFHGRTDIVRLYDAASARTFVIPADRVARAAAAYDLVHVHAYANYPWIAALPHPKLVTMHWRFELPPEAGADHVICVSPALADLQHVDAPVSVVPCAVDLARFDRARALATPVSPQAQAFLDGSPLLVRVARPGKVDRPVFWAAARKVLETRDAQLLVVHHDEADRTHLAKLPAALRRRVLLHPASGDVPAYVARADLFFYAAHDVGGDDLVLKEAMALEVPVVATRAVASFSGAEGGILTERDPASLAAAAIALLDAPDERARLAELGRRHVERCWAKFAEASEHLYRRHLPLAESAQIPGRSAWRRSRDVPALLGRHAGTDPSAPRWTRLGGSSLELLEWAQSLVRLERPRAVAVIASDVEAVAAFLAEALRLCGEGRVFAHVDDLDEAAAVESAAARSGLAWVVEAVPEGFTPQESAGFVFIDTDHPPTKKRLEKLLPSLHAGATLLLTGANAATFADLLRNRGFDACAVQGPTESFLARRPPARVRLLGGTTGYGTVGTGGDLGYGGARVRLRGLAPGSALLSAHADSDLELDATPGTLLRLRGAIDDGVRDRAPPVHFQIADAEGHPCADLGIAAPGQPTVTADVLVPPDGRLRLRATAETKPFAHAVWIAEHTKLEVAPPGEAENPAHHARNETAPLVSAVSSRK